MGAVTESGSQGSRNNGANSEAPVTCSGSTDVDGNDLLSYWPALGECEATPCALQTWGSERRLGLDTSKDAANNNQPDLALTSGDETSLGRAQHQRKGMIPDFGVHFRDPRDCFYRNPGDSCPFDPGLHCQVLGAVAPLISRCGGWGCPYSCIMGRNPVLTKDYCLPALSPVLLPLWSP